MMDFHTLTIADKAAVQAVSLDAGRRNCNFTFANLVGWQFLYGTEVCVLPDAVVFRFSLDGKRTYMVCTQETPSCELLQALLEDSGHRLTLMGLENEAAVQLQQNACRKDIHISVRKIRDQYDYIYRRDNLATLRGGRLQARRNHVNRFLAEYPGFEYRPLEPSLFDDCRRVAALWHDGKEHDNPVYGDTLEAEKCVMETVFSHWNELEMLGGSIFIDGRMVAFTYGAAVTKDTFDVCVEKADLKVDGAFSIINQQFCSYLPEKYTFVNREEDMGLPGLRRAKLSYHPEILLSFNVVHIA